MAFQESSKVWLREIKKKKTGNNSWSRWALEQLTMFQWLWMYENHPSEPRIIVNFTGLL